VGEEVEVNTFRRELLIVLTALMIAMTAHASWLYLAPGYDYFGFRDREGVLHAWQAD
jgi:hypothetical protein